ncbi:MAG TPA: Wzz/FepE/Etk N-terminal domain-containing protein, partial [Chthoniobacterales bacterium]
MAEAPEEHEYSSLNLGDILYAIFKHKWKILICAIAGFSAAAAVHVLYTPVYESHAKLLVRYVLERTPIDPDAGGGRPGNIIGSEVEILTSWDLAMQVAEALGPKRLLPGSPGASVTDAAGTVSSGLRVFPGGGSNIIFVTYRNSDPELARVVLDELVNRYFNKHLEVHRSAGAFDFVTQQTDQVRARLNETEDALRELKAKAGVVSLADSTAALSASLSKVEEQLYGADEELAEQRARVKQMEEQPAVAAAAAEAKSKTDRQAATRDVQHYQAIVGRLNHLRGVELDLLSKYTPANLLVKLHQDQIDDLEKQKAELEEKFPDLASAAPGTPQPTLASERARLAGLEAKAEKLRARLASIRENIKRVSELGSQIADLERNQEL